MIIYSMSYLSKKKKKINFCIAYESIQENALNSLCA